MLLVTPDSHDALMKKVASHLTMGRLCLITNKLKSTHTLLEGIFKPLMLTKINNKALFTCENLNGPPKGDIKCRL